MLTGINRADTASVKPHRIQFHAAQQPVCRHCRTPLDYPIVLAAARLYRVTNGCWAEFRRNCKICDLQKFNTDSSIEGKLSSRLAVGLQLDCSQRAVVLQSTCSQFLFVAIGCRGRVRIRCRERGTFVSLDCSPTIGTWHD